MLFSQVNRMFAMLVLVLLLLFCLFFFVAAANAATPPTAYTHLRLTWLAPTTACTNPPPAVCDDVSLDEPITDYQIFIDTKPIPDSPTVPPTATVPAGTLLYNTYPAFPLGSTIYMRIRARNGTDVAHTGALTGSVTVQAGQLAVKPPQRPGQPAMGISFTTTPP